MEQSKSQMPTLTQGNFIPQYKKKRFLHKGNCSKTYLVEEIHTKKEYVMKTINLKDLCKKAKEDSFLEAKILKKFEHPNIIHFEEAFICKLPKHTLNIITEFADGGDLSQKIEKQIEHKLYFEEDLIINYFTQICLALNHVHSKNIILRDINDRNIFLTKNGIIKLGGFHFSKKLEKFSFKKKVIGTHYLSPEIVKNEPYNYKNDIWSLGVMLYRMTTLKLPFDANNLQILVMRILKGKYNPIPNNYSKELAELISRLLKVNPEERPNVTEILNYDIIKERMKVLIEEVSYYKDFRKTL
jgi:NIMA (never in mitosis gene a)-related kinase